MRLMRYTGVDDITIHAAHRRTVRTGDVVDFDEHIQPRDDVTGYSFEAALGTYADRFEAAPVAEATVESAETEWSDVQGDESQNNGDAAAKSKGRKKGR
jgi:hypothetical protein